MNQQTDDPVVIALPSLAEGETYLTGFIGADGRVTHVVLLPGDNDGSSQPAQMEWAQSIGGDLMTLAEQAIAYEKYPEQFKATRYWSNRNDGDGYAWYTNFHYGYQLYFYEDLKFRGRAVRRVKN